MGEATAFYLGHLPGVTIAPNMPTSDNKAQRNANATSEVRPSEVQLIDKIENAQLNGRLPYLASENSRVEVVFSKHGIKITDCNTKHVLERLPLHKIAQAVSFASAGETERWNVVFKCGNVGKSLFSCYVLQVQDEASANNLCDLLKAAFQTVVDNLNVS